MAPDIDVTPTLPYASWGRRLIAWLIDLAVVGTPIAAVWTPLANLYGGETTEDAFALLFLAGVPTVLFVLGYHGLLQAGKRGQTVGKSVAGIAVRRAEDFGSLGYGRSFARAFRILVTWVFFGSLSFFVIPLLDGLWALVDRNNQTVHDKLSGTVVVRLGGKPPRHRDVEMAEAVPEVGGEAEPESVRSPLGSLGRDRYLITRREDRYQISADGTPVAFADPRGKTLGIFGEEISFFADDREEEGLFTLDWGAIADVVHVRGNVKAPDGSHIGTLEQVLPRSVFRSRWRVLVHSAEMARAEEKSLPAALVRRLGMRLLVRYRLTIFSGGRLIGEFTRSSRSRDVYELDLTSDEDGQLDRRLAVALGVAMAESDHSVFD